MEVPSHAEHSEHDADPGFQEFNRLADAFQPEDPSVYGGQLLHAVCRHGASASAPRAAGDDGPGLVLSGLVMLAAGV